MNIPAVSGKHFLRKFFTVSVFTTLTAAFTLTSCQKNPELHFQGPMMGTQYKLVLACESDKPAQELLDIAVAEMNAVNESMSTYLQRSELSEFNRSESTDWQNISPALLEVMEISQAVSQQSDGAFDATISPLVELWGFGASKTKQLTITKPDAGKLQKLKESLGYQKVALDSESKQWRKLNAKVGVDLSAVAKGYAVDQVSLALSNAGCDNHLVDIGGELKLSGRKNNKGDLWRIAIEKPNLSTINADSIQKMLELTNVGVASSGDYRNFYQIDGERYSHTIDPRTAAPIKHNLAAVTVLHEQTAVADAWATAFMVLGEEAPLLAEKLNLAAYFIYREPDSKRSDDLNTDSKNAKKYRIVITKQFDKFLTSK